VQQLVVVSISTRVGILVNKGSVPHFNKLLTDYEVILHVFYGQDQEKSEVLAGGRANLRLSPGAAPSAPRILRNKNNA